MWILSILSSQQLHTQVPRTAWEAAFTARADARESNPAVQLFPVPTQPSCATVSCSRLFPPDINQIYPCPSFPQVSPELKSLLNGLVPPTPALFCQPLQRDAILHMVSCIAVGKGTGMGQRQGFPETKVPYTFMDRPPYLPCPVIWKPLVVMGRGRSLLSLPCLSTLPVQEALDRHTAKSNSLDIPVP